MFPASVQGPGTNLCVPDVCLTPVGPAMVPIPYVNIGLHALAQKYSSVVRFGMMPALNTGSTLSATQGDEAGTGGGVASGTVRGTGYFRVGSPVVMVENLPAIRLTSVVTGNNNNATGTVISPGIPTVLIADGSPAAGDLAPSAEIEVEMLGAGVCLLPIERFHSDAVRLFFNAWARAKGHGATAAVIDLRGCPGGDLHAAYQLAAEFLPMGALLGETVDDDGDRVEHRTHRDGPYDMPLVILIDDQTRSAAEAFAGALAHHQRAVTVGSKSFGKGTFQGIAQGACDESSSSRGQLLLPNGESFASTGIRPTLELADTL